MPPPQLTWYAPMTDVTQPPIPFLLVRKKNRRQKEHELEIKKTNVKGLWKDCERTGKELKKKEDFCCVIIKIVSKKFRHHTMWIRLGRQNVILSQKKYLNKKGTKWRREREREREREHGGGCRSERIVLSFLLVVRESIIAQMSPRKYHRSE